MYYIRSLPINDAHLQHYGIKGMKWGVVRSPEQLGHPIKAAKAINWRNPSGQRWAEKRINKRLDKASKKLEKMKSKGIDPNTKLRGRFLIEKVNAGNHLLSEYDKFDDKKKKRINGFISRTLRYSSYNNFVTKTMVNDIKENNNDSFRKKLLKYMAYNSYGNN